MVKLKDNATARFTITFHSRKLRMINRPINTTLPKVLMPGVLHLGSCCLVTVTVYLLAPFVSSVNITQFTSPPSLLTLSVLLYNVRTVSTVGVFCARVLPSSYTRCRGLLMLHHRCNYATFEFDNNKAACYPKTCFLCCHKSFTNLQSLYTQGEKLCF